MEVWKNVRHASLAFSAFEICAILLWLAYVDSKVTVLFVVIYFYTYEVNYFTITHFVSKTSLALFFYTLARSVSRFY